MRWEADSFLKWTEYPWWLRWLICLIPIGIAIVMLANGRFMYWLWGIGGVLCLINLYLTWNEILDRFMPRKGHDDDR